MQNNVILILLFFLIGFYSCESLDSKKKFEERYFNVSKFPEKKVLTYHTDKQGLKNGVACLYNSQKEIIQIGCFYNDRPVNYTTFYNEDGIFEQQSFFYNTRLNKQTLGEYKYYKDGTCDQNKGLFIDWSLNDTMSINNLVKNENVLLTPYANAKYYDTISYEIIINNQGRDSIINKGKYKNDELSKKIFIPWNMNDIKNQERVKFNIKLSRITEKGSANVFIEKSTFIKENIGFIVIDTLYHNR